MFRIAVWMTLLGATALAAEPTEWWSLRPITKSLPPTASDPAHWVRTPIDAFVWAKLQEKGLKPAKEADRRTLIRRVYFDLIGLPPTPAEIAAFVNDPADQAYERVVDRLLASPHYGERWARHWMDVVHFAETHGHDQDRLRPNAWRYRDYLINAFNEDTPYARFIQEQIAADVLFADQPALIPALGFLSAGPWDESSLRDIREDSIDRQAGYYLDRDDMVTTVMSTVQSLTVHCARCHNHKFDPISQADYYSLQAIFAGAGRADREFDADLATHQKRQSLRATLTALDRNDVKLAARLQSPDFRRELAAWEGRQAAWVVLNPESASSANGATLTVLPDGSVRSEGKRPDKDTCTVCIRTHMHAITAVRLEALADDALPHRGPGRQDNGNFHLSEFRMSAGEQPIALRNPTADYDQPGWSIRQALDGDPKTAWGIYPQVGRPHECVFELSEPLASADDRELTFVLDQLHGGGHLIGRFRLSATAAPLPVRAGSWPLAVSAALAIPAAERTAGQWRELGMFYLREQTKRDMAKLPPPTLVYAAAADFTPDGSHKPLAVPRPVHVLVRGDVSRPGPLAKPASLHCLAKLAGRWELPKSATDGERRAALARWLTCRDNPLTWRSIVNRVWHYHFGRGLVDTPNDFGHMGSQPTHPELLDWLAAEFRDNGGSLKKLQRMIVTSAVYRQSSQNANHPDSDNRWLDRMPRSRLDAEQVRDAVLLVSDRLDRTMGGPSDQQFTMKPGRHVTPVLDYSKFDWDRPEGHRRSVYRLVYRTLPDPFIACLDGADASQLTAVRTSSISAPQSLALMNNEFILVHSRALAKSLAAQAPERGRQIELACERVWGRPPTRDELQDFEAYAQRHGLANLCRLLFNANDFLFVD